MNLNELLELWIAYLSRRQWDQRKAEALAKGDSATVILAEKALAELPQISALEALQANADLVNVLSIQRFIAMQDAREQGISLEQIGKALGISRQSAWEFFQRKLAGQQRNASSDKTESGGESQNEQ